MVYLAQAFWDPGFAEPRKKLLESEFYPHGGETETSMILAIHPGLAKMDQINEHSGKPLAQLQHLTGLQSVEEESRGKSEWRQLS